MSNETLTSDDAHSAAKCEHISRIYREAYDEFAGPREYRHASNMDAYHRAGLIAVWNAAKKAQVE